MPVTISSPNRSTGSRRLTLTMLAARDHADGFTGLPRGTVKPLRFLAAFQEAEPYLGLPVHAFKLVSWLVKQTMPQDWEEGSRPIAWPSARRQAEFMGLSPARVKHLNRALFEAGIFVIRDNEQGKRYGRRDAQNRIIEAYGFDLSPLALRYDEFVRLAAEARIERERMRGLRKRLTIARRAVRQAAETLASLDALPASWARLAAELGELVAAGRRAERSEDLALIVKAAESRKSEAEQWMRDVSKPMKTTPTGLENEPHITSTNLTENPTDTVIASEECKSVGAAVRQTDSAAPSPSPRANLFPESFRMTPGQLIELAPRLQQYMMAGRELNWPAMIAAADWLRGELGISTSLWHTACRTMGEPYAAVAVAVVSTHSAGHFTSSAGGYFAGMLRKFEKGELCLARTIWRLRNEKWGKNGKVRVLN